MEFDSSPGHCSYSLTPQTRLSPGPFMGHGAWLCRTICARVPVLMGVHDGSEDYDACGDGSVDDDEDTDADVPGRDSDGSL